MYTLNLGWYRKVDGEAGSLDIINPETGEATGATSVTLGPVKIGGPPDGVTVDDPAPQVGVDRALGNVINLLGYDPPTVSSPTGPATITFYWRALASPEVDYTVFVHIRNAAGEVVAQMDSPPVGGAYPTSLWDADEIIVDEISLPLADIPSGDYTLVVGLYDFATGQRLAVPDNPANEIVLETMKLP